MFSRQNNNINMCLSQTSNEECLILWPVQQKNLSSTLRKGIQLCGCNKRLLIQYKNEELLSFHLVVHLLLLVMM